jgi:hypothetical protein
VNTEAKSADIKTPPVIISGMFVDSGFIALKDAIEGYGRDKVRSAH